MNKIDIKTHIDRIKLYQEYYDEIKSYIKLNNKLNSDILKKLDKLENYYTKGLFLEDYELDEKGLIPKSLNREILTEDALYDLFTITDELKNK